MEHQRPNGVVRRHEGRAVRETRNIVGCYFSICLWLAGSLPFAPTGTTLFGLNNIVVALQSNPKNKTPGDFDGGNNINAVAGGAAASSAASERPTIVEQLPPLNKPDETNQKQHNTKQTTKQPTHPYNS